ncbi:hypothetical protein AK812_SmicGene12405 [Symbiodinium microadriaticum]|uniref:Uncharacterized protein n=1 Tax=Symbiodinium microadriaticum TaxID=2951 RepID=A0A1Q9EAR4_SYMMI|nr:hypothetical protein AK812_SmicGene12405 [Symbiodinium microadriaticum]
MATIIVWAMISVIISIVIVIVIIIIIIIIIIITIIIIIMIYFFFIIISRHVRVTNARVVPGAAVPGIAQAVLVKASNADFGVYADKRTWLCEHGLAQILEKLTTAPSLVIFAMTSLLLSVLSLLMNRAHPYVDVTKEIVLEHERQVSCNGRWLMLKLALHQALMMAGSLALQIRKFTAETHAPPVESGNINLFASSYMKEKLNLSAMGISDSYVKDNKISSHSSIIVVIDAGCFVDLSIVICLVVAANGIFLIAIVIATTTASATTTTTTTTIIIIIIISIINFIIIIIIIITTITIITVITIIKIIITLTIIVVVVVIIIIIIIITIVTIVIIIVIVTIVVIVVVIVVIIIIIIIILTMSE